MTSELPSHNKVGPKISSQLPGRREEEEEEEKDLSLCVLPVSSSSLSLSTSVLCVSRPLCSHLLLGLSTRLSLPSLSPSFHLIKWTRLV